MCKRDWPDKERKKKALLTIKVVALLRDRMIT